MGDLEQYFADASQARIPRRVLEDLVEVNMLPDQALAADAERIRGERLGSELALFGYMAEADEGEKKPEIAGPYRFLISDSGFNRRGDRVISKGIDFAAYKKNPVLLWAHDQWAIPIGRVEKLEVEGDRIYAWLLFDVGSKLGAEVAGSVSRGFLKACSIGIRILAMEQRVKDGHHEGWDITESEMLELSVCPIGANSRALKNSYGSPSESLSAIAKRLGWNGAPDALMSLRPGQIEAIRPGLTRGQLAQDVLARREFDALSVGFYQLGLAEPWTDGAAWARFAEGLGGSQDPEIARRCALAAGLSDLAALFAEIPPPAPAPPAPATALSTPPTYDLSAMGAALAQTFTAGAEKLNAAVFLSTGTPALK